MHDMTQDNNRPLVILSAYQSDRDDEFNRAAHDILGEQLEHREFEFGEVEGCYKGTKERAYLVEYQYEYQLNVLVMLAKHFKQESILSIAKNRTAALLFMDTHNFEVLGKLEPVPELVAKQQDAWTRTSNGQYYITRGEA